MFNLFNVFIDDIHTNSVTGSTIGNYLNTNLRANLSKIGQTTTMDLDTYPPKLPCCRTTCTNFHSIWQLKSFVFFRQYFLGLVFGAGIVLLPSHNLPHVRAARDGFIIHFIFR